MIRFLRLTLQLLDAWLVDQRLASTHARYRLRVWRENHAGLAAIQAELIAYINEAFEDARRRIRQGFEDNLSPFNDPMSDPAAKLSRAAPSGDPVRLDSQATIIVPVPLSVKTSDKSALRFVPLMMWAE